MSAFANSAEALKGREVPRKPAKTDEIASNFSCNSII